MLYRGLTIANIIPQYIGPISIYIQRNNVHLLMPVCPTDPIKGISRSLTNLSHWE